MNILNEKFLSSKEIGRNHRWSLSEVQAWFDAQESRAISETAMKGAVNS